MVRTVYLREICEGERGGGGREERVAGPGGVLSPTHPGLWFGSTSVILFIHRTMGAILLQFLISDQWKKDQSGYTTN